MRASGACWGSGAEGSGAGAAGGGSAATGAMTGGSPADGGAASRCFATGWCAALWWRRGRVSAGRERSRVPVCGSSTSCATGIAVGLDAGVGTGGMGVAWASAACGRRWGSCCAGGRAVAPAATDAVTSAPTATFVPGENASAAR